MSVGLLHNMSAPPKTVISFNGLDGSLKISGPGEGGVAGVRYKPPAGVGIPVKFEWKGPVEAIDILLERGMTPGGNARNTLIALIESKARELALPDGVAVIPFRESYEAPWGNDAMAALAILTKSSESVWLQSKSCTLSILQTRRSIALLIPAHATQCIKELYKR
jgi:hypothetical protein